MSHCTCRFKFLFFLLLTFGMGFSQTGEDTGPGEFVIEVDSARSKNEGKSLGIALGLSALLPGSGEYYLQDKKEAKAFWLVEAGFWAAFYLSLSLQNDYFESARNFAVTHAGMHPSRDSEDFLNAMEVYRSYREKQHRQDSYETSQVLSGEEKEDWDIPPNQTSDWDFGTSLVPENTQTWNRYRSTLRYYRASKIFVSFAFGALAMNRLASLVNTLHLYRTTSISRLSWSVQPDVGIGKNGLVLNIQF